MPPRNRVFWNPSLAQNIAQAESGARFWIPVKMQDPGFRFWSLGPKTKKMRAEKMQNPASRIRNGAIWCNLWPEIIL